MSGVSSTCHEQETFCPFFQCKERSCISSHTSGIHTAAGNLLAKFKHALNARRYLNYVVFSPYGISQASVSVSTLLMSHSSDVVRCGLWIVAYARQASRHKNTSILCDLHYQIRDWIEACHSMQILVGHHLRCFCSFLRPIVDLKCCGLR